VALEKLPQEIPQLLDDLQKHLFEQAKTRLKSMWHKTEKLADFGAKLKDQGGFYQASWCGNAVCETALKDYQATIRCMLLDGKTFPTCFHCGEDSAHDVLIAKAY